MPGYGVSTPYGSLALPGAAGITGGPSSLVPGLAGMGMGLGIPSLSGGAGGNAGPATASSYNPVSFTDGSFVVSGSPSLGASVAGAVAGATNSFAALGSLQNAMPYLAIAAVVYFIATHRKKGGE